MLALFYFPYTLSPYFLPKLQDKVCSHFKLLMRTLILLVILLFLLHPVVLNDMIAMVDIGCMIMLPLFCCRCAHYVCSTLYTNRMSYMHKCIAVLLMLVCETFHVLQLTCVK